MNTLSAKIFRLFLIPALFAFSAPASAEVVRSAHTQLELLSEASTIHAGENFWVGVKMTMDAHWHTYWKHPGDSGMATGIVWDLPPGFTAGDIHWPYPHSINEAGLTTYGYDGEILLLTEMTAPKNLREGESVSLGAKVTFLACEKICIPGEAQLTLTLPVSVQKGEWDESFARQREALPIASGFWSVRAAAFGDDIRLDIRPGKNQFYSLQSIEFIPDSGLQIDHAAGQMPALLKEEYILNLKKSPFESAAPARLSGLLISAGGWRGPGSEKALKIDVPVEPVTAAEFRELKNAIAGFQQQVDPSVNFWLAFGFAFLGGLILNLMPCVLPVLSLKVLHLVEDKDNHRRAWRNGVCFAFGVVVSFWILAGILIALRAAGAQIGWGFQFQSPQFIAVLAGMFVLFVLNLFGVYEIGLSLTTLEGRVQHSKGAKHAFLTGIVATVAATPCTAPFMGTALGFALSQPVAVAWCIFTALGLGMSFPYLVLSRFPQLLKFVPRPGAWMITFKKAMGVVLMMSVLWLMWVFTLLTSVTALMILTAGFLVLFAGAAVYGRSLRREHRRPLVILAALLVITGFAVGLWASKMSGDGGRNTADTEQGLDWVEYSPALVEELKAAKKPFFIDFTAAWCLSCQVNDRVVFHDPEVIDKFRKLGIVAVKADWTRRDEDITRALAGYGKSSIPLYVVYKPDQSKPVILPEIITPAIVIEALGNKE